MPAARCRKLASDVVEMRERIFAQKGSQNLWDIKQVRGGLIDLEFLVQYLQLLMPARFRNVWIKTPRALCASLLAMVCWTWGDAETLIDGAWRLHTLTQILRLCTDGKFDAATAPTGLKNLLVRATNSPDFARLEARLSETHSDISALFKKYISDLI